MTLTELFGSKYTRKARKQYRRQATVVVWLGGKTIDTLQYMGDGIMRVVFDDGSQADYTEDTSVEVEGMP